MYTNPQPPIPTPSETKTKAIALTELFPGYDPSDNDPFIDWLITEGNMPAATIPIALGRSLGDLSPGGIILVLSYGAGGSFTCALYEVAGVMPEELVSS